MYKTMFKRGFLPDAVARQDPVLLLNAIVEEESEPEIPKGMEFFYGL